MDLQLSTINTHVVRTSVHVHVRFTVALLGRSMTILSLFVNLPSPWRILEDCGAAFVMGCIGGGVFSYWKGYRNSPPVSYPPGINIVTCVVSSYQNHTTELPIAFSVSYLIVRV